MMWQNLWAIPIILYIHLLQKVYLEPSETSTMELFRVLQQKLHRRCSTGLPFALLITIQL